MSYNGRATRQPTLGGWPGSSLLQAGSISYNFFNSSRKSSALITSTGGNSIDIMNTGFTEDRRRNFLSYQGEKRRHSRG